MSDRDDFILALATRLRDIREFSLAVPDEACAEALFFDIAYRKCCPACRSSECLLLPGRAIRCSCCPRVVSLTAQSPLRRTKVALRHWLAAIWHIHIDTESITSRGFARKYGLRPMTAWNLLRIVRLALTSFAPQGRGLVVQVLGRESERNQAMASVCAEEGGLTVLSPEDAPTSDLKVEPVNALISGRLTAWIGCFFRGVSSRHRYLYFAEFADRYGRASRRSLAWHDPVYAVVPPEVRARWPDEPIQSV